MAAARSKPAKASWAHWAALTRINCGGPPVMPPAEPATSSNSLSTGPGQTWVTTTPVPSRSARNASLKPSTKCLLAEYAAEQGITARPAPDPMLSTPPRLRSTIPGTKAAVKRATATTLVASTWRVRLHSARVVPGWSPSPALLTRMSTWPASWSISTRARSTSLGSARSAATMTTRSRGSSLSARPATARAGRPAELRALPCPLRCKLDRELPADPR